MGVRSYLGLVGNGETAALIAPDLAVSWLCVPRFDGTPVFAGALDPVQGGSLTLHLTDSAGQTVPLQPAGQTYRGDSALLETRAEGQGWLVETLDYMPWGRHGLVREVRVVNRSGATAAVTVGPVASLVRSDSFPVSTTLQDGLQEIAHREGVLLVAADPRLRSRVAVPHGGELIGRVCLAYGPDRETALQALDGLRSAEPAGEAQFWAGWLAQAREPAGGLPPAWLAAYRRGLVVMKLLSYEPTGALVAAPTASFPAVPGGGDNWDYRFAWLRDGYYTAMSFDAAGLHAEAARFYDFVFALQGPDGHWRQPLYTVDGKDPVEFIAHDLQGPGGERPVRFGNAASAQLQLDNEGNILHGLWYHYLTGGDRSLLERHWQGVSRACEWTAANWRRVESGIWELRQYQAHWVHGKALCYAALEAGARIALALGHADSAERWRTEAARVRAEVVEQGWNRERQAYLRHYGAGAPAPCVDISALALVFYGLLLPDDPRVKATVALMEREQGDGGLVLLGGVCRYDYAAVPFYLPTLWLARYYLMAGRLADCDRLLQTCLDCATDLGLMAEHFDGVSHTQWGNFPQAFSHEEMARLILERAAGKSEIWQE